ncbi:MAG: peptide chain release factor N(5)-glutamine methyltransferase [Ferruginibacter sp.]
MTVKEIYRGYLQQLQQIYNANESAVMTDLVFEKVAALQRADIIKYPEQQLNIATSTHLQRCLEALLRHEPVQYVLGEAWFYKLKFIVNEHVLIPRPETEELVQLVIDGSQHKGKLTMLDIGTGSGCIAIAIKKNLPAAHMLAIDVSQDALSVAKRNAIDHQADIQFLELDFLNESSSENLPVLDVIVSNPPYIPISEKERLDKNVTDFEPHLALFVPDNAPLLFYEKIAAFGEKHLHSSGQIHVEIHEDFALTAKEVFEKSYLVKITKDMFGKERMLTAVHKSSNV